MHPQLLPLSLPPYHLWQVSPSHGGASEVALDMKAPKLVQVLFLLHWVLGCESLATLYTVSRIMNLLLSAKKTSCGSAVGEGACFLLLGTYCLCPCCCPGEPSCPLGLVTRHRDTATTHQGWWGGEGTQLTTTLWQRAENTNVPVCKGESGRKCNTSMKSESFPDRCVLCALIIQETQPCGMRKVWKWGK